MLSSKKATLKDFRTSLMAVAELNGVEPHQISEKEYLLSHVEGRLNEDDLNKEGGFKALRSTYFPPVQNVRTLSATKLYRAAERKLTNRIGKDLVLKDDFLLLFEELCKKQGFAFHPPIKLPKKSTAKAKRTVVVHLSDTHYGANIDREEMAEVNQLDWTVASRRTAFVIEQAVSYKRDHRKESDLVILLNGDIIAGVIHSQEWGVDLLADQFKGAIHILVQAISYAAQNFSTVRVVCTPGNHGRAMHKMSKDRATIHKWDSYENMVYSAIETTFRYSPHKNVSIEIPKSPFAIVEIQGHQFFVTHGDTVVNVGNPGKSLNIKSINEQINKLNSQVAKGDQHFAAVVCGHVHVQTVQETESGTMLMINGSLSGTDQFAQSIGIFSANATQTLFEVVPEHAVGDIRFLRLRQADDREYLDKIVAPYQK